MTVGRLVQGNNFSRTMHYVYALLSEKDNNFYIGFTENFHPGKMGCESETYSARCKST